MTAQAAVPTAKLLDEFAFAVAVTQLIESGDRMLGRGVTQAWRDAHAASCRVLDRCEAAGIAACALDAVIAQASGAVITEQNVAVAA